MKRIALAAALALSFATMPAYAGGPVDTGPWIKCFEEFECW